MKSNGPGEGRQDKAGRSAGHAYFRAIEETFLDERGAPLTLNADDWHLTQDWHGRGMPLEWVRATLREIFTERRGRGTADAILSLRTLRRSVEAAWKRQRELLAPAESAADAPQIDIASRLESLANALPADFPARGAWRARILACGQTTKARPELDVQRVEEALAKLDEELLASSSADLDGSARTALLKKLDASRRALAGRMPASALAATEAQLRERLTREALKLPVLSLFAPEASS